MDATVLLGIAPVGNTSVTVALSERLSDMEEDSVEGVDFVVTNERALDAEVETTLDSVPEVAGKESVVFSVSV